jgi:hypothetical protein
VRAGVHEDVQGGERCRQILAGHQAGEASAVELALELTALRAVADHDQPNPGQILHGGQQAQLLLVRQPAHVTDDELSAGGPLPT